MRSLKIVLLLLLGSASVCSQTNGNTQGNPLTVGIARNQQELLELSKFISENNAEMRKIVGEMAVSLAASVAGASPESKFGQSPREAVANLLGSLQKLQGALETSKNALDGEAWLAISGQLKLVLDVIGEEELPVRFANTLTDLLVKIAQLVSLARQNADLVAAKVQIAQAQTYLLAKAASIRIRRTASQSGLLPQIKALSDLQSKWLLQQYKDKPQVIQLAVKTATARDARTASQIANGLQAAGGNVDALDLSDIPGINPDAVIAMRRCNAIALTMVQRQMDLTSLLNSCPKAAMSGGDRPRCPAYERAALQNAAINRSSMTCNKYSDGSYIQFFGVPRGVEAMNSVPALPESSTLSESARSGNAASEGAGQTGLQAGVAVQYQRQSGQTGISVHNAGGQVLDSTKRYSYGVVAGNTKSFSPGSYIINFWEPGFGMVPIEVRQGYMTVITASPARITLLTEEKEACACLSVPGSKAFLTPGFSFDGHAEKICGGDGGGATRFNVSPGTYDVVTVDRFTMFGHIVGGGCTSRLRSGYIPIPVTLQPGQTLEVTTHPGGTQK